MALLYALGGADATLTLYCRAWEGLLRQYTEARTREVPFARDGMYFREFPVMMDWLHHGEGLTAFAHQGLCEPDDPAIGPGCDDSRDSNLNDDPLAPNYDRQHKIIRSLFNGSRGPCCVPRLPSTGPAIPSKLPDDSSQRMANRRTKRCWPISKTIAMWWVIIPPICWQLLGDKRLPPNA